VLSKCKDSKRQVSRRRNRNKNMENLEAKFEPYTKDLVFLEVLDLVKKNSKGRIWIIGGFVYRNLVSALYGGDAYNYDIDFIVEERNDFLLEVPGWQIQINKYGSQNYVRESNRMSFTDIRKVIRVSGLKNPTIKEFIEETPLNIQSIAYDLEENNLIGEKGIEAILHKAIKINNIGQAEFYAKRKGKDLKEIIKEKAKELHFSFYTNQDFKTSKS
jgi:hypothetical protein